MATLSKALSTLFALLCSGSVLEGEDAAKSDRDVDERGFSREDYSWWAVQPVSDPAPPAGDGWCVNPIDQFVAAKLSASGLAPTEAASPAELVRRIYFDLHGLPPQPAQVEEFVSASADGLISALEGLVDTLLASPRYGERWGQHWLDVARYSESDGYRADFYRSEAWRYRDYVIRAFNEDKPFNQFVREQLAGDEIAPDDPETAIATAFLRHGIYEYNQRNARMHWELILNEMTNVTGEAFLGLGVGCSQCHDHKFDPILQKDYYSLQAFLSSVWWPEDRPHATPQQLREHRAKLREWERKTAAIRSELSGLLSGQRESKKEFVISQFPEDVQAMYYKGAEKRTPYEEQLAQLVERQIRYDYEKFDAEKELGKHPEKLARYRTLKEQLESFNELKPSPLPMAFVTTDVGPEPAQITLKSKDSLDAEPGFFAVLRQAAPSITPSKSTTGRRSALADWIASPDNPLSTRVIVNRIWQHHFGRGIVATPNDFGTLGESPSHPSLLDWLTSRFIEGGWKIKSLHRLILMSATYRQTSRREPSQHTELRDPSNRLLWRFSPRRLSAEELRDAMLAVSGELVVRDGGPSASGKDPVRSIYVKKMRNTPDPILHAFDAPSGFDSAPDRLQTTTPAQSLMLANNDWPRERAQAFAERVLGSQQAVTGDVVDRTYRLAYGRSPDDSERASALNFVRAQMRDPLSTKAQQSKDEAGQGGTVSPAGKVSAGADGPRSEVLAALTELCHALLSSNEFLYLH